MNVIGKIIALWGVLVLAAWGIAQFVTINYFGTGYTASALMLWTVAMAIALVATYRFVPNASGNKVVKLWTVITVVGMVLAYVNFVKFLPVIGPYIYYHVWVALTAVGFALTAMWWTPKSKMLYAAAAGLNIILLALVFLQVDFATNYSLILAGIVGGIPPILDGVLNYDIPKPAPAPVRPAVSVKVTIK